MRSKERSRPRLSEAALIRRLRREEALSTLNFFWELSSSDYKGTVIVEDQDMINKSIRRTMSLSISKEDIKDIPPELRDKLFQEIDWLTDAYYLRLAFYEKNNIRDKSFELSLQSQDIQKKQTTPTLSVHVISQNADWIKGLLTERRLSKQE